MNEQRLPSFPGGRIQLLLRHSVVSESAVRRALALPEHIAVADVFAGHYSLSPTDLVAMADLLDVPVTVLSGQVPIDRHLGVSLRLGSVEAADVPNDALEYADKLLRYKGLLDSWLGVLRSPLAGVGMSTHAFHVVAGQKSAQRIRDGLRLGKNPIPDLVNLVERLGFPVAFRPLPESVHGLNVQDQREGILTRLIIVSTRGPWTLQRYTLAHELCHALYNDAGQVIVDVVEEPVRLPEIRAESFARHLLLPADALAQDVRQAQQERVPLEVMTARLMVRWGMSKLAILRALENDQLANRGDTAVVRGRPVDQLMAAANLTERWRALSSGQADSSGSSWLVRRALEAYSHGWVDASVVADLLDQDVEVTRQQLTEQGWAAPAAATE